MPIYIYECEECKRTMEVIQKINDPVLILHNDMTEGHIGLTEPCKGKVKRIIQTANLKFKGKGWTRKFFR